MSELKTPDEWSAIDGIRVMDPDGWRIDGKSWDEPISHAEWMRRVGPSTVDASEWMRRQRVVCSECGTEACAQGDLYCEDYRRASIVEVRARR